MHSDQAHVLFTRLSDELSLLASKVERIEDSVAALYNDSSSSMRAEIVSLQEIDLVQQSMRAIANVLKELSALDDADIPIDMLQLLETVPLEDLKHRLAGTPQKATNTVGTELF